MGVICVLPARISSTRISRKPLQPLAGRTLLEWCWRAASAIRAFDRIVIATDNDEIEGCARGFDAEVVRTRPDHLSGTDRVDEAADLLGAAEDDVVVNFQADEPFVDGGAVEGAVRSAREVATIAAPIRGDHEWRSPAVVKVARAADGRALYFSRSPIPFTRDASPDGTRGRLRHVGVYACRRSALKRWAALPESALERAERLEQLRALEAGMRIHVELGPWTEPGVDLPADIARAERVLSSKEVRG
ncbi:MAG: 3-deoxy-manno-octulosonate cytidylyltransferase [Gemmatimonadales bacterium]|nr:3-deoxy-manno-octulosonate cytidylyltransferase [Gemmatimonadales bacterium]MYG49291.1 3-deoxy-manno-octulosonate cytidylyltransferase [Gemmatimonadales bacterium]MYK00768.1 3-deoxy-manno-octulosonate cytidylyltransferase [Candidatus Palauibacter ramosifaciens]